MNIVQVYRQFPTRADCIAHLERVRWHGVPVCPYCRSTNCTPAPKEQRYHCNNCNSSFSVTVQTIFHKTKVDLQKWFVCISLVLNAKKGIAARQLGRDLEVTKDTAWYMAMRIRRAMMQYGELLRGIVEMDESYVGGKPRKGTINNPDKTGKQNNRGRGTNRTPVVGVVERGGSVHAQVMHKVNAKTLSRMFRERVDTEQARLFTDQFNAYCTMAGLLATEHKSVNHGASQYVDGEVHTNTIDGFWALLKRGIAGQYHKISVQYLQQYVDEFCYRYSQRSNPELFELTLQRAVGVA